MLCTTFRDQHTLLLRAQRSKYALERHETRLERREDTVETSFLPLVVSRLEGLFCVHVEWDPSLTDDDGLFTERSVPSFDDVADLQSVAGETRGVNEGLESQT